ncbi:TPA: EutP/PduV family microcompartment system protein [Streptococcus suis]|nr:hypothetical protein [Streptococcus suis]NQN52199.1 hypothetical protein [Streptococcus suis]HEM3177761.1 hypothetical protein [Streptococcus suis]
MKKRILVIGPEGSGKKELVRILENHKENRLISSIVYSNETIFVPGSYLRSSGMKKHIIATQQNAYCILMLLPSDRECRVYSPNFAQAFRMPRFGIVTYRNHPFGKYTDDCREELTEAGVDEIFEINIEVEGEFHQLCQKLKIVKEGNQ